MILKGLDSRLRGNDRVVVRARFWMTPAYDMRGQACRGGGCFALREMAFPRGQIPRLRFAALGMTNGGSVWDQ